MDSASGKSPSIFGRPPPASLWRTLLCSSSLSLRAPPRAPQTSPPLHSPPRRPSRAPRPQNARPNPVLGSDARGRSGGPGGQSVNTTDSAVRITHIPTGVVVSQQDEKSQHKNKAKALKILRSRVYEAEKRKKDQERADNRKSQIGTGDRSERIRTYNFPQGRVTDHRINLTLHKLDEFLSGEIHEEMNESLRLKEQDLKLKNLQ